MWKQASDVEQDFIECNIDRNQVALFLQSSHLLTIMIVMISIKVFSENILNSKYSARLFKGLPTQLARPWYHPHLQEEHRPNPFLKVDHHHRPPPLSFITNTKIINTITTIIIITTTTIIVITITTIIINTTTTTITNIVGSPSYTLRAAKQKRTLPASVSLMLKSSS